MFKNSKPLALLAEEEKINTKLIMLSKEPDELYVILEKIVDINSEDMKNMASGTIVYADCKKGIYIKTVDGILQVLEIQGENSKRMTIEDYLRGNKIEVGKIFKK